MPSEAPISTVCTVVCSTIAVAIFGDILHRIRLARFGGARNAAWRDLFSTAWRWRMDMARLDAAVARAVSVGRLSPALLDGGALHTLEKDVRST